VDFITCIETRLKRCGPAANLTNIAVDCDADCLLVLGRTAGDRDTTTCPAHPLLINELCGGVTVVTRAREGVPSPGNSSVRAEAQDAAARTGDRPMKCTEQDNRAKRRTGAKATRAGTGPTAAFWPRQRIRGCPEQHDDAAVQISASTPAATPLGGTWRLSPAIARFGAGLPQQRACQPLLLRR
jgi:hypothetical protein